MNECLVCHLDHSKVRSTCDYEPCGECGYDHEYETQSAIQSHKLIDDQMQTEGFDLEAFLAD